MNVKTARQIRCGLCDFPQQAHTDTNRKQYDELCFRDSLDDNWGYAVFNLDTRYPKYDYERSVVETHGIADVLLTDVQGPESLSGNDLMVNRIGSYEGNQYVDEIDYTSVDVEDGKLERWHDTAVRGPKAFYCTPTLEQMQSPQMNGTEVLIEFAGKGKTTIAPAGTLEVSTEARNAYIEGASGFTSVKLLDEELTKKYHQRILNVFADKATNDIRIGSIRLRSNVDGTKTATCVRNDCIAKMTSPVDADRNEMETFVLSIIRHGNNHAAKWFTERDTFYKVHEANCDGKCDPNQYHCYGHSKPAAPKADVDALVEHHFHCNSVGCNCTELLMVGID